MTILPPLWERPDTFGRRLRDARRAAHVTQRELATSAGIDTTYVSKLENDRLPPPAVRTILRLAAHLGADPLPLLQARCPVPRALETLSAEQWAALAEWLTGMALTPAEGE